MDVKFPEIKFTTERLEVDFKGRIYQAFGTTDPNLVFIPTIGKFINRDESLEQSEQQDPTVIFLKENRLTNDVWSHVLSGIPSNEDEGDNVFYLKLEYLGNKHYVDAGKKDKLIEWMKLTEELFL